MVGAALRLLIVAATAHGSTAYVYAHGHLRKTATLPSSAGLTATWAPSGKELAWADGRGVWIERADGSGRRRVLRVKTSCSTPCVSASAPIWSPDGTHLIAGGVDPATTGLVSIDIATGRAAQLVRARRFAFWTPIAFSPDGTRVSLAYTSGNAGTASCCKSQLRVMNADGSHVRVLFDFKEAIHDGPGRATWSPDGTRIAFTSDGRDAHDPRFAFVDVSSGTVHRLPGARVYDVPPAWSPDGTHLAVGQYQAPAFAVRADGRDRRSLGQRAVFVLWLRGDRLLFVGRRSISLGRTRLLTLRGRDEILSLQNAS